MEVMGGASLMEGDWESICRILSFDPNTSTSQCELGFPTLFSYSLSQSNGGFVTTNENGSQLVQSCLNEDDDDVQMSSLTMNSDGVETRAEVPSPNKRISTTNNRKMYTKVNEEEQKWSRETSENESNGSHQLMNEVNIAKKKLKRGANRGAATDPQSLYARKRRERINERLRILQNLVPNGTKVDLSTMLEEAVNYVKFLQMQIKLLSSEDTWMYAPLAYNGFHVGL